jgi:radical SAM protein with 4Fe4S-binding SPASM domain
MSTNDKRSSNAGPSVAYLLPTGRCNLHCSGCYATLNYWGRHSKKGELSIDEYRRVIDELAGMGVKTFDISGGEPLLYPNLIELCEAIRSHAGTRIWLVTNGTVINHTQLEALSRLLERLVISLDAPVPELHDELRGLKGAFDKSLAILRAARKLPFPEIAVNQLICRPNVDSVSDMVRFCGREQVDRLALLSYRDVSENGVMPDMIPDLDSLRKAWQVVVDELMISEYPKLVDLVVPSFLFPESSEFRRTLPAALRHRVNFYHPHLRARTAYLETVVVKPFGMMSGDTAMVNTDFFDLGSIRDGVRAVWNEQAPAWRERLAERQKYLRMEGPCRDCSRWNVCRGGCPAAAFHQWGPEWKYDRSCDQFRKAGHF